MNLCYFILLFMEISKLFFRNPKFERTTYKWKLITWNELLMRCCFVTFPTISPNTVLPLICLIKWLTIFRKDNYPDIRLDNTVVDEILGKNSPKPLTKFTIFVFEINNPLRKLQVILKVNNKLISHKALTTILVYTFKIESKNLIDSTI